MTTQNQNVPATITLINPDGSTRNKIFVTIEGEDWQDDLAALGLTFNSSEREIMERISPIINEEYGIDITNHYKVRKATNSENIFVIPASVAGI